MPDNISNLWLDIIGVMTAIGLFISLLVKRMTVIMDVGRKIFKSKSNSTVEEKTMASETSDEAKAAYRMVNELKGRVDEDFRPTKLQDAICGKTILEQTQEFHDALDASKKEIIKAINGDVTIKTRIEKLETRILNAIASADGKI